jgi:hypothetical protein
LKHPDYPDFSDSIKISSTRLSAYEINFDTLYGFLHCQVYPWGEINIEGKVIGITPFDSPIPLSPGKHKLEIKNPDYEDFSEYIEIIKNDTLFLNFNFEELPEN